MEILQVNEDQQKKLATVLKNFRIQLFEYIVDEDKLVVYDDKFHIKRTVTDYMEYIDHKSKIHPDDREKVKQLYMEVKEDPVEIREIEKDGTISHTLLELTKFVDEATGKTILVGNAKDITEQKEHEKMLKEKAMKDSDIQFSLSAQQDFGSGIATIFRAASDGGVRGYRGLR